MFEIIAFAFWFTILASVWGLWKRTIRDFVRDHLFDLRDEWRNHWVSNEMYLGNPCYRHTRNKINSCLRYTAHWRMMDMWYVALHIKRIKPIVDSYNLKKDPEPMVPTDSTAKLVNRIKSESLAWMKFYMLTTSVTLFPILVVALSFMVIKTLTWDLSVKKAIDALSNVIPICKDCIIESAVSIGDLNINFA